MGNTAWQKKWIRIGRWTELKLEGKFLTIRPAFNITVDHCAEVDALIKEKPSDYHVFGPLKEALLGEDMSVIMKFRTRCIYGFDHNQKLPLQMGSKGLWTATKYVLEKKSDCIEKLQTLYLSHCWTWRRS